MVVEEEENNDAHGEESDVFPIIEAVSPESSVSVVRWIGHVKKN